MDTLVTIRDFLRWGMSQFSANNLYFGHGTDNAWDDAVALLCHAINLDNRVNDSVLDAKLTKAERKEVLHLFKRRIKERKPAPYITGRAWFAGLMFKIDERAIIPRSLIAEGITNRFSPWLKHDPKTILDMCTGSGCIAIACSYVFPEAMVTATDLSEDALALAEENVEFHQRQENINLKQSDLFEALPKNNQFDLIVSNPPYVSKTEHKELCSEYQYEPKMAFLGGGDDGLDLPVKIMQQAVDYLSDDGVLIVEVGYNHPQLAKRFPKAPFTWIEHENGGEGVFLLTRPQLLKLFAEDPLPVVA